MRDTLANIRSAALTPVTVAFVASERVRRLRVPAFAALQRLDPVHHSPLGLVILSRYQDVSAVLRSTRFGSDERKADPALIRMGIFERLFSAPPTAEQGEFLEMFRLLMLFQDPPEHTRLRSLVAKAFTPRRVQALRPRIVDLVEEFLAPARRRRSIELMQDFAYPLPARVICELLGVPADGVDLFVREAPKLAIALDPAPMRTVTSVRAANEATRVLREYMRGLIQERRDHPQDDMLSALVHAEADGARLSEDELVGLVLLLVIAGHETTANVIGNAMRRLVDAPAERARLATGDEALTIRAVEEFLRLDGPVQMVQRVALDDQVIGGRAIRRGQLVVLLLSAANRDPSVFDRANQLWFERERNPHLAFGGGHHHCIGAPLARLELAVALPALARLGDSLRIAARPRPRPSFTIAGLEQLHLAW